jgi:hypothetical protein
MTYQFKGYHGTSDESAKEIISSDYELSKGDNHWLGDGIYFFIDGISSKPEYQAQQWAIAQSWDSANKKYKYNKFCTISSTIEVNENNFLDLTTEDGLEILEYLISCFENKIKILNKQYKYLEGCLINLARGEGILPIEVAKGNFYIKFSKERINNINLRTSNCTVCCVHNPKKNLANKTIVNTGGI